MAKAAFEKGTASAQGGPAAADAAADPTADEQLAEAQAASPQAISAAAGSQLADGQSPHEVLEQKGKPGKRAKEEQRLAAAGAGSDAAQLKAAGEAAKSQPAARGVDAEQLPEAASEDADNGIADTNIQGAVLRQLLAEDKVPSMPASTTPILPSVCNCSLSIDASCSDVSMVSAVPERQA